MTNSKGVSAQQALIMANCQVVGKDTVSSIDYHDRVFFFISSKLKDMFTPKMTNHSIFFGTHGNLWHLSDSKMIGQMRGERLQE